MYNTKQIIIYSLLSFLLSLIITTYYLKKISSKYYLFFVLLFIVFYLFFYLINMETINENENKNENENEFFNNYSYYINGYDTVTETLENNNSNNLPQIEPMSVFEEEHEEKKDDKKENTSQPIQEEEENQHVSGNIGNGNLINNVKGNTCSPVNINIYNGDGQSKVETDKGGCPPRNRNLGDYNSRVYNNSDWIYGNSAWTNAPDFYIPRKNEFLPPDVNNNVQYISQKVNEVLLRKKFSDDKNVCPMMINTPWSEYKSGDKEPSGYQEIDK